MKEIKFDTHRVPARKDLLHFVEEHVDSSVCEKLGQDPRRWVDELNLINQMLTREPLVGGTGMSLPPAGDEDFRELGNGAFLYRGEETRRRGLWIKKESGGGWGVDERHDWSQYRLGSSAILIVNREFSDVSLESLMPENFEPIGEKVEKFKGEKSVRQKRPIFRFSVNNDGGQINVYAKGSDVAHSFYYSEAQPRYRLTPLSSVHRTTSKREMETTLALAESGVNVPSVIGYYEACGEEFLFLEEVVGKDPREGFGGKRRELIEQDAEMLAALCLRGFRKCGFADFDDKIFDGKKLYLIDVDECRDLYFPDRPDYREMLMDPQNTGKLSEFREHQRSVFRMMLRDALYSYRPSLTPTRGDQEEYISAFFGKVGWDKPDSGMIDELTTFPDDYVTFDRGMAIMIDCD